jgi:hypothetical protein
VSLFRPRRKRVVTVDHEGPWLIVREHGVEFGRVGAAKPGEAANLVRLALVRRFYGSEPDSHDEQPAVQDVDRA